MKKIEKWMIDQIHYCMDHSDYCGSLTRFNTTVSACYTGIRWTPGYDKWIEVKLNSDIIAVFYPFTSRLIVRNADGIINRSRINAIFREFAPSMRIEKRDDRIMIIDKHRMWIAPDIQPLTDNWYTTYGVAA
jgi:hypothetical protein